MCWQERLDRAFKHFYGEYLKMTYNDWVALAQTPEKPIIHKVDFEGATMYVEAALFELTDEYVHPYLDVQDSVRRKKCAPHPTTVARGRTTALTVVGRRPRLPRGASWRVRRRTHPTPLRHRVASPRYGKSRHAAHPERSRRVTIVSNTEPDVARVRRWTRSTELLPAHEMILTNR